MLRSAYARRGSAGHRLHLAVEIAVSDDLLLGTANSIADELRPELADHIPGLEATLTRSFNWRRCYWTIMSWRVRLHPLSPTSSLRACGSNLVQQVKAGVRNG